MSLIIGAFILLMVLITAPANAAPLGAPSGTCGGTGTVICIDPATQTIGQNQVTTVDIRVDNIPVIANDESLFGVDVRLSFNPFILCVQDGSHPCPNGSNAVMITPGSLLTQSDAFCSSSCYTILTNNADNTAGTIKFIMTRLNPAHSISGSGVLATVTFYGLGGPSSQIHFTNAQLSNRDGGQIPATIQDGVINVNGPTAVVLSSFGMNEKSSSSHEITLVWTTASEVNTAGFNVYRSERADGLYSRINSQLIPASSDPLTGGKYQYQDTGAVPGRTYYYQLEDVELDGASTRHPPIPVRVSTVSEPTLNPFLVLGLGMLGSVLLVGVGWRLVHHRRKGQLSQI